MATIQKLIAKGLGYCILLGALGVKVPQMINIIKLKSADGK